MAAEDEGRTEEPSEYKLEKARKEGRVAKSQEVSSSLILLLGIILMYILAKWIFGQCLEVYRYYFSRCASPDMSNHSLYTAFLNYFLKCLLPFSIISIFAAFIGNIVQTRGFLFSWKPIQPKFSNILPHFGEYFKKTIFSGKGIFNIVKSILKVAFIITVAYFLIKKDIFVLIQILQNGQILMGIAKIAKMAAQILIIVAVFFLAVSIVDYFIQRREFMESMKMTKQEQKEEYKELEGDPEVKGRLRQAQMQLLQQNIPRAVSESDVIIANPTHFAVGLKYDQTIADFPKVTVKGEDQVALTIRRIAEENDVPVVENKAAARGLYTETEVGDIIPESYYNVIAVIYSQILNYSKK
ncbi:MAG: flagellar biosynthesis protein FlhB [Treponema sp.]|nr:flagellar biosynthesis protein FlhB [Treponema sp.]